MCIETLFILTVGHNLKFEVMNKFSFLITFISLFVALGISDLLISLHKLLRIRKQVKWYWLLMLWAFIILLFVINMWFGIYHYFNIELINTSGGFFVFLLPIIFLLLASFAVLPDKPQPNINLREWYFNQKSYIFTLLLLNFISFAIVKVIRNGFQVLLPLSVIITLLITLIFTKKQWVHITITIIFLILTVFMMITQEMYLK